MDVAPEDAPEVVPDDAPEELVLPEELLPDVLPELPEPVFPLSAAFLSISAMTESEYSASLDALTKETTSCTSSSVIKQPCTRLGLPCPSGA